MWLTLPSCTRYVIPVYQNSLCLKFFTLRSPLPQLVSGPGVLPLFPASPFDIPLGGQSAAEDLMESFGFEAELGPAQAPRLPSGGRAKEGEGIKIEIIRSALGKTVSETYLP